MAEPIPGKLHVANDVLADMVGHAALECYGEEHNRFSKLFQINVERNHVWGYSNKVDYAEGFLPIKMLMR